MVNPMIADDKATTRRKFSERLNGFLDRYTDAPEKRGRPQWLSKKLGGITHQSTAKWLNELDIPDQTNLARLCEHFNCNPTYLLTGMGPALLEADPLFKGLEQIWADLRNAQDCRTAIVEFAEFQRQKCAASGATAKQFEPGKGRAS